MIIHSSTVRSDGMISLVHDPNLDINTKLAENNEDLQIVYKDVRPENVNYFKIKWNGDQYPSSANQCANGVCESHGSNCLCDVDITLTAVFNSMPTKKQVIDQLKIGHAPPESYDAGTFVLESESKGVHLFVKNGNAIYDKESVFGIEYRGKMTYFQNMMSTVSVAGDTGGVAFEFRNPPHFLNVGNPDTRDAIYETEAVLDHYFYHSNTAPFLATRLIKRFGISNPSPRYVKAVAKAFIDGTYAFSKANVTFGDGMYGNLEATAAAVLMDKEMRSIALDADPTSGSLREPLIKVLSFLRAMEYTRSEHVTAMMMTDLQDRIGQDIHNTPSVFSFFLPDFSPPGKLSEVALTSPEAQVLDAPKVIALMNGLFSLVDIGMSNCYGGLGDRNTWWCDEYLTKTPEEMLSRGFLEFEPASTSTSADDVVNELALLLTGGRLNSASKTIMVNAYEQEVQSNGAEAALKVVQKLLLSTPEFHSTNVFDSIASARPENPSPQPSSKPYKAIVYINLDGGLDSFNMLVPHSNCDGDTGE